MDQQTFNGCLKNYQHPIMQMLMKKVYGYRSRIADPGKVAEDLYGSAIVECLNLKYETMDEETLRRACFTQAKDSWIKYLRKITSRQNIMDDLRHLHEHIESANHGNLLESKDLWQHLRQYLTPHEELLFTKRVVSEVSYKDLSLELKVKQATLRKQFERIRKKLYEKMLNEALMQHSK